MRMHELKKGTESTEKYNVVALRLETCVINWVAATYKFPLVACVKYSFVATKKCLYDPPPPYLYANKHESQNVNAMWHAPVDMWSCHILFRFL